MRHKWIFLIFVCLGLSLVMVACSSGVSADQNQAADPSPSAWDEGLNPDDIQAVEQLIANGLANGTIEQSQADDPAFKRLVAAVYYEDKYGYPLPEATTPNEGADLSDQDQTPDLSDTEWTEWTDGLDYIDILTVENMVKRALRRGEIYQEQAENPVFLRGLAENLYKAKYGSPIPEVTTPSQEESSNNEGASIMESTVLHASPSSSNDPGSALMIIIAVSLVIIALMYFIRNYQAIKAWFGFPTNQPHQDNSNRQSNLKTASYELQLLKDEKIIKEYFCAKLIFPRCEGHLTVTDRRVIFHGVSKNSRIFDEVKIETVSGVSSFYGGRFRPLLVVIGLALTLAGLIMLAGVGSLRYFFGGAFFLVPLLILLAGVIVLFFSYKKVFFLKVYSSQATGSPIEIGEGYGGLGGNNAVFSITASPTEETDKMMLELGKVIYTLQDEGNLASGL